MPGVGQGGEGIPEEACEHDEEDMGTKRKLDTHDPEGTRKNPKLATEGGAMEECKDLGSRVKKKEETEAEVESLSGMPLEELRTVLKVTEQLDKLAACNHLYGFLKRVLRWKCKTISHLESSWAYFPPGNKLGKRGERGKDYFLTYPEMKVYLVNKYFGGDASAGDPKLKKRAEDREEGLIDLLTEIEDDESKEGAAGELFAYLQREYGWTWKLMGGKKTGYYGYCPPREEQKNTKGIDCFITFEDMKSYVLFYYLNERDAEVEAAMKREEEEREQRKKKKKEVEVEENRKLGIADLEDYDKLCERLESEFGWKWERRRGVGECFVPPEGRGGGGRERHFLRGEKKRIVDFVIEKYLKGDDSIDGGSQAKGGKGKKKEAKGVEGSITKEEAADDKEAMSICSSNNADAASDTGTEIRPRGKKRRSSSLSGGDIVDGEARDSDVNGLPESGINGPLQPGATLPKVDARQIRGDESFQELWHKLKKFHGWKAKRGKKLVDWVYLPPVPPEHELKDPEKDGELNYDFFYDTNEVEKFIGLFGANGVHGDAMTVNSTDQEEPYAKGWEETKEYAQDEERRKSGNSSSDSFPDPPRMKSYDSFTFFYPLSNIPPPVLSLHAISRIRSLIGASATEQNIKIRIALEKKGWRVVREWESFDSPPFLLQPPRTSGSLYSVGTSNSIATFHTEDEVYDFVLGRGLVGEKDLVLEELIALENSIGSTEGEATSVDHREDEILSIRNYLFKFLMHQGGGVILVSGPKGCGKSWCIKRALASLSQGLEERSLKGPEVVGIQEAEWEAKKLKVLMDLEYRSSNGQGSESLANYVCTSKIVVLDGWESSRLREAVDLLKLKACRARSHLIIVAATDGREREGDMVEKLQLTKYDDDKIKAIVKERMAGLIEDDILVKLARSAAGNASRALSLCLESINETKEQITAGDTPESFLSSWREILSRNTRAHILSS